MKKQKNKCYNCKHAVGQHKFCGVTSYYCGKTTQEEYELEGPWACHKAFWQTCEKLEKREGPEAHKKG